MTAALEIGRAGGALNEFDLPRASESLGRALATAPAERTWLLSLLEETRVIQERMLVTGGEDDRAAVLALRDATLALAARLEAR